MSALMESAKGMLSNGATPDVELEPTVSVDQIPLMQDVKKSSKRDGQHMSALMEAPRASSRMVQLQMVRWLPLSALIRFR
jgi:hypothetical protein